ncbi:MAG: hypothetical protein ACPKPY_12050 [Nitrososphaeraceae archaeon]
MFGLGKIKVGHYVFVIQKQEKHNNIIIGKVQSVDNLTVELIGTLIKPIGLIERLEKNTIGSRSKEVLNDPDPNNCIFILIDRVDIEDFNGKINQSEEKVIWINEKRFFILEGWIKENFPDMFADVLRSANKDEWNYTRTALLDKMNSLYDKDLKDHVYAVVRSTKIL